MNGLYSYQIRKFKPLFKTGIGDDFSLKVIETNFLTKKKLTFSLAILKNDENFFSESTGLIDIIRIKKWVIENHPELML